MRISYKMAQPAVLKLAWQARSIQQNWEFSGQREGRARAAEWSNSGQKLPQ